MACFDVVTIDGPGGAGKSTVARRVALELNFSFLDTGAMYRAVALAATQSGIQCRDSQELENLLRNLKIEMLDVDDQQLIHINGVDITQEIRCAEISRLASDFSTLKMVRAYCVSQQREIGCSGKIVAEGRDMGTVVFPDARWKFFLTASSEVRAARRFEEERSRGEQTTYEDVLRKLNSRDNQDSHRKLAPLKPASDAVILDTSNMTVKQVVDAIVSRVYQSSR